MCDPVTMANLGTSLSGGALAGGAATAAGYSALLGGASTALQIQGQRTNAKIQRAAQKQAAITERQRYLNEVSSLRAQQAQEAEALAQKLQANKRKAMEAQSTGRLSALTAGVSGISVDALKQDLSRKEAMYNQSLGSQSRMLDVRRELALRDAGLGFTNNMLRINKPIEEVDYASAVVSGAKTGLSTYGTLT